MMEPSQGLRFLILVVMLTGFTACSTSNSNRLSEFPLSEKPLTGKFVWHDLITDDVDQAKHFYSGLLGWSFEDTTHPTGGDYTLITSGQRFVGGIVKLEDPANLEYSRWLGYLSVADVDQAVAFTRSEGGTAVVGPLDLPGIGRVAAIQDPQNAVVGLLRSRHGDPDDSLRGGPGMVVWDELLAADDLAARGFYSALAGFQLVEQHRERGIYHVLMSQGQKRAGIMQRPSDETEPFWLTHFGVRNVEEAARIAAELGGEVLLGPDLTLRQGLLAVVVDPGGAILALHQWTE